MHRTTLHGAKNQLYLQEGPTACEYQSLDVVKAQK
jgi:hypothetical protein